MNRTKMSVTNEERLKCGIVTIHYGLNFKSTKTKETNKQLQGTKIKLTPDIIIME